jgi:hypothetical protein
VAGLSASGDDGVLAGVLDDERNSMISTSSVSLSVADRLITFPLWPGDLSLCADTMCLSKTSVRWKE